MDYKITYDPKVIRTLEEIYNYILEHFQSEQAAQKKINSIIENISSLKTFPEAGFNADEKFGLLIDSKYKTRGLTLKKDYIALYTVDHENKVILITYLLATKSDYMKLFK
ncbi:type II toxin-antitoxin system RelE/ParE family toxin [Streptococcus sp. 19428wC2_LYSM12]|uniref:type II toxin-antitoxin system RelE/ParE family toxin n=1 Tax=unclassified Streptococcus TaxID=2608887 RepID=UPI001072411D|nr:MULTISPECIES: type II toxin-antitoxin system RelE/ParE family toxin [unclassified Streptococcus]MBF0786693.1 type II toxin-antitoxin system RelE/ParE family toxin [Streptococcus sp. 19428wC2_LYSM12]TFV06445.1 type II toxin-antitoxin system RelE/ParE family toxin [Streptococcus sp. LYSM12]HEN7405675.1 type II toxin-antitoxin system RelE/ParE family toxin [Streptococcus agalactiae]